MLVIQVENPLSHYTDGTEYPLVIQNKEKTLIGFIEKKLNAELYSEIVDVVRNQGWRGSKAFFYCIVEKRENENNNLTNIMKINLSRVLPVESW